MLQRANPIMVKATKAPAGKASKAGDSDGLSKVRTSSRVERARHRTQASLRIYRTAPCTRPTSRRPVPPFLTRPPLQAQQQKLEELKEPFLRFLKKRDAKTLKKLARLAEAGHSGAASLALAKVGWAGAGVRCVVWWSGAPFLWVGACMVGVEEGV